MFKVKNKKRKSNYKFRFALFVFSIQWWLKKYINLLEHRHSMTLNTKIFPYN